MANGKQSLGGMIRSQEDLLLRRGQLASERFDQIRQRHIWSAYHFYPVAGGAIVGNLVQTGKREVFKSLSGSNGQGLPAGFQLSLLDTNSPSIGRVSDDQNFSIWELGVTVRPPRQDVVAANPTILADGPVLPNDVDQICENVVCSIKWLTNEVPLGVVADFQQSGGPDVTGKTLLDYTAASGTVVGPPATTTGGLSEGSHQASPWGARVGRISQNAGPVAAQPALRRRFQVPIYLRNGLTFSFLYTIPRAFSITTVENGGTGGFSLRFDWWCVESFREQG